MSLLFPCVPFLMTWSLDWFPNPLSTWKDSASGVFFIHGIFCKFSFRLSLVVIGHVIHLLALSMCEPSSDLWDNLCSPCNVNVGSHVSFQEEAGVGEVEQTWNGISFPHSSRRWCALLLVFFWLLWAMALSMLPELCSGNCPVPEQVLTS